MGKWWKGWEGHRVGMVEVDKVRGRGNLLMQSYVMTMP